MKILIDILHPAHVHFFRHFRNEMDRRGHTLLITARAKECSTDLLQRYGLGYTLVSRQRSGTAGLLREMLESCKRPGMLRETLGREAEIVDLRL